jgi:Patatin-like phospholipase
MIIPENAYKVCSDRLFISITVLTRYGPVNKIVSQFSSNDDLLQACMASSTLPYLTERAGCRTFRGEYVLDGGLTNNIPVFTDGVRRQLVFRLFDVEYPWRLLINAQGTLFTTSMITVRSVIVFIQRVCILFDSSAEVRPL